jgi:hypothetical protein
VGKRKSIAIPCESCGHRPRGAGGKLSRCLECLKSLVERERRLRDERVVLRHDKLIRAKLSATRSGALKNNQRKSNPMSGRGSHGS